MSVLVSKSQIIFLWQHFRPAELEGIEKDEKENFGSLKEMAVNRFPVRIGRRSCSETALLKEPRLAGTRFPIRFCPFGPLKSLR